MIVSKLECAVNKKLLHVIPNLMNSMWLLVFEHGTICQVGMDHDFEPRYSELKDVLKFEDVEYSDEALFRAEIINAEYVERKRDEEREERQRRELLREQMDRAEYERLKAKFEGSVNA